MRGKEIVWVGVLDLAPRIRPSMEKMAWTETILTLFTFLDLVPPPTLEDLRGELRTRFSGGDTGGPGPTFADEIIVWILDHCDKKRFSALPLDRLEFLRWVHTAHSMVRSASIYEPTGKLQRALMIIFCATGSQPAQPPVRGSLNDWQEFFDGRFEIVDVGGELHTMLSQENIMAFSETTRNGMHAAEERTESLSHI